MNRKKIGYYLLTKIYLVIKIKKYVVWRDDIEEKNYSIFYGFIKCVLFE